MRRWIGGLAVASLAAGPAAAQDGGGPLRERLRARFADRMVAAPAPGAATHRYGSDPLQALDIWPARSGAGPRPLILFVHGGGWKRGDKGNATGAAKVEHYTAAGYAFGSVNYRLVPAATVEQQATDVAAAVAWARRNAASIGVDPARIILMGHSAGAHLVALVGTDPRYLSDAGETLAAVRGVIALDGAGYQVDHQIRDGDRIMQKTYAQAFGSDPARRRLLSPTLQAAAPNAPAFLIAHVERADGTAQAQGLADALRRAGTPAELRGFEGRGLRGHMQINRRLGDRDYPATAVIDEWIARRLAG